jgi:BirA family transcriptional regulator, biotin operon repressor / biotin---[acetyl-CoA-carboxylase] ligase
MQKDLGVSESRWPRGGETRSLHMNPQPLPEDLVEPLARAADRLGIFRDQVLWYADTTSTNDLAATMAERGVAEGRVVVANAQSAGRGRQGRTWVSPPGAGLYMSVVLRPHGRALPLLTIAAGVAVAEGIQSATGLAADVKWPNDVYVHGRKVAGILAEASSSNAAGAIQHVIVGAGINVMPAAYPPEIAGHATSLEAELGRPVDRGLLLAEYLCALATRYADLRGGRSAAVVGAWRVRAASTLGRRVQWEGAGATRDGVALDIDDTGALVVRTAAGPVRVTAGEVRWV